MTTIKVRDITRGTRFISSDFNREMTPVTYVAAADAEHKPIRQLVVVRAYRADADPEAQLAHRGDGMFDMTFGDLEEVPTA